jgi:3'(2'), 5'-bisphosphate nucleotidase
VTDGTARIDPRARELAEALRLARAAGKVVLDVRGGDLGLGVEMKAGDEPVTIADRRSSELIVAGLRAAFPDDVVISEENPDDPARLTARRVWYIDPIDGTKDFIRGESGFAVMIGMTEDSVPTVGVVYQAAIDRMFWATPDGGAWTEAPDEPAHRMTVSTVNAPGEIRLVASKSHRSDAIDRVKSALGIANELNIGSVGLKLALIALGERDLYVNPWPKCKAWDTCAPEAIIRAAGGVLTDLYGAAVRYDETELARLHGLVASNGHVHEAVIGQLASLFPKP